MINFFVHGHPVAQGRPRFVSKDKDGNPLDFVRAYDPKTSKNWKETVKWQAIGSKANLLLQGPLKMTLVFRLSRPKSLPKKVKHHIKKPDIDNLKKAVADALEGICYERDQQICEAVITKEYATEGYLPGVIVKIEQLED